MKRLTLSIPIIMVTLMIFPHVTPANANWLLLDNHEVFDYEPTISASCGDHALFAADDAIDMPEGLVLSKGVPFIYPSEVEKGGLITIKVNATNSSPVIIDHILILIINNKSVDTAQLSLDPHESEDIIFKVTAQTDGNNKVNIGNLHGFFIVKEGSLFDMFPLWIWTSCGIIIAVLMFVILIKLKKKPLSQLGVLSEQPTIIRNGQVALKPTVFTDKPSLELHATGTSIFLNNRYDVLTQLRLGGMAIIELATDTKNDKLCIIKKPRMDTQHDIKINAEKIAIEAAYLMQFNHPNVVRYIDLFSYDNLIHLVVDFVEGEDLFRSFAQVPASESRVIKWAGQILDALEYVHKRGVVHRDINPGNIMLRKSDDNVVIIDFGTIKPVAVDQGTVVGKPGFEVPEQIARGYSDERSDLYGVGSVLFYVLTSKPPGSIGKMENLAGELRQHGVSERMSKCVEQALQMDAKLRFSSASAMRKAMGA